MSTQAHCKACGEVMTEGRAYELGNHRWHIKCFRCTTCNDQLSAHTNMLVLGDGTLVCANCSYTCVVCNKKITDMAVLTSDQAFCASCFVCRNCKKTIDDLQYARTSQGIFCMDCHTMLMARKQQKLQQKLNKSKQSHALYPEYPEQSIQSYHQSPHDSHSGIDSSKSSLISSLSINRNKELPDIPSIFPSRAPENYQGINVTPPYDMSAVPNSISQSSILDPAKDPKGKRMRVPRKQLAPSAFQGLDDSRSDFSSSQASLNSDVTPVDQDKNTESTTGSGSSMNCAPIYFDKSMDSVLAPLQDSFAMSSLKTPVSTPGSTPTKVLKHSWSSGRVTPEPGRNGTTLGSPPAIATPKGFNHVNGFSQESTFNSEAELTPTAAMNVPQRSQLRHISPGRPGLERSPSITSPQMGNHGTPTVVAATNNQTPKFRKAPPPPVLVDQAPPNSASPTQAAAPQQTQRSPFNRWWHKRDQSVASVRSAESSYTAFSTALKNHKRSLSENEKRVPDGYVSPKLTSNLSDALAELALERQRAADAEAKLEQLQVEQSSLKNRDNLIEEISRLEAQLAKLREECKIYTSRNNQLKEMNAELERQTLEKFGPNSLWGSLNPQPYEQPLTSNGVSSAPQSTTTTKDPGREFPLVTKLDDHQPLSANINSVANQAQFLPLKSAKQWFFRKPNKLGQVNQITISQPNSGSNGTATMNFTTNLQDLYQASRAYNPSNSYNKEMMVKPAENSSGLLGETLAHRTEIDKTSVPYFVTRCFAEVESRGIDTEGIYRKPGSKSQVDAILQQFGPQGDTAVGEELLSGEIQAVTSAVKQYLRRLAEPVITYDCYDAFMVAGNTRNLDHLVKAVKKLPIEHFSTLKTIILHLALVASHDSQNLMNVRNLAIVFAPTIFRDQTGEREIPDMQARNEATQMLIVNANTVFTEQ